jgi:uncharacterized membrane protein
MNRKTILIATVCIMMLAVICSSFIFALPAMAMQKPVQSDSSLPILNDTAAGEKVELTCQYPVLSSYAGLNYSFTISVLYTGGKDPKTFDLSAKVPQGFNYTISPGYGEGSEIRAVRLDPTKGYPESIKISITPYVWKVPAPGSYPIVFSVSSGDVKSTIELTAIVTANFDMKMSTPDGRLNTEATAGQDNNFTVTLTNTGSGDMDKVAIECLSKDHPSGWTVTCKPDKIDSFKAGDTKEIQVTVKPTDKTISGDYIITVQAEPEGRYAFTNLQIRVTVLTPTIWGWIGVGIVVLVILALAVIFIRFGRR